MSRPGDSPGRTEQRRLPSLAQRRFAAVADKCRVGMQKRWNITGIVIADFMPGGADCGHHIRLTQGTVADEKESGFGAVALQDVQNLRRKRRMRAIIERKRNKPLVSVHAVNDVRREPLERRERPSGSVQNRKTPNSAKAPPMAIEMKSRLTVHRQETRSRLKRTRFRRTLPSRRAHRPECLVPQKCASRREQREPLQPDAIQQGPGTVDCGLVASGGGRRRRHALARS